MAAEKKKTMNRQVKILIVNVHSSRNAGDLALLQTTIDLLRHSFKNATFWVSSNFTDENAILLLADRVIASPWKLAGGGTNRRTRYLVVNLLINWFAAISGIYHWKGWPNKSWLSLFEAYHDADLVVAVSGNQFFSSGRYGWPLLAIAMSVQLAKVFKKPVYIMPQSIGPFRSWWEKLLLRRSYSTARKIFIRDFQSLHLAGEVKLPSSRVQYVPDPAFTLKVASDSEAQAILEKYGYKRGMLTIGVTVIASMPSYLNQQQITNYYAVVASSLSELARKCDLDVFFFHQVIGPSNQEDDRIATSIVTHLMSISPERIHVIEDILKPDLLKACYGRMDIFLASRLHSGIFSLSMGIPTVFIGYLSKTRGILEALGIENNILELGELSQERLFIMLENTWLSRNTLRTSIIDKISNTIKQIQRAVDSIEHDYEDFYG